MSEKDRFISQSKPFDYDTMLQLIYEIKDKFPFIKIGSIGESLLGRSLPLITLGKGKKSVIYIGAHHGMEWITSALLLNFVNDFCNDYVNGRCGSEISSRVLFETRKIFIIPMLNPDGVDYAINGISGQNALLSRIIKMNDGSNDFSHWQANARGVDLNHNYSAGFKEYKIIEREMNIINGAPGKYSGEHPESEPETRALCNFVRLQMPELAISLHTQGEEIYFTSNQNQAHNSLSIVKTISRLTGYKISFPTGTAKYGGFTDWFIEEFDRPSLTIECGLGKNPLPFSDHDDIYSRIKRSLYTIPILI